MLHGPLDLDGGKVKSSMEYDEYLTYNNVADPAQLVNLAARVEYKEGAARCGVDCST